MPHLNRHIDQRPVWCQSTAAALSPACTQQQKCNSMPAGVGEHRCIKLYKIMSLTQVPIGLLQRVDALLDLVAPPSAEGSRRSACQSQCCDLELCR